MKLQDQLAISVFSHGCEKKIN